MKNDVATSEDPAAGVAGDAEGVGTKGGVTGERVWKVGCHRDNLLVTYQPRQRNQNDDDILKKKPTGTNGA